MTPVGDSEQPVVMPVGFMSNHTVAELVMERDRLREALDNLAHAAREFDAAAGYTVATAVEDEFIAALEAAEALL